MKTADIIDTLRSKLMVPGGRHLYGVLGTYAQLKDFTKQLTQARTTDEAAPQLRQYVESFCLVLEECWKDKSLTAPRSAQCQLGTMVAECRKLLANA